jgi:hypothetical protein
MYARCSCRDGHVAGEVPVTGRVCKGLIYAVWLVAAAVALVALAALVAVIS